jgi:glutaminase
MVASSRWAAAERIRCRASDGADPGSGSNQSALNAVYTKYKDPKDGKNADYIPALARVDPKIYGIVLVTTDGEVYTAGDVKSEVSIRSISKVSTVISSSCISCTSVS